MIPKANHSCPLCGGPNACAPARSGSFDTACWCRDVQVDAEALARIPAEHRKEQSCLCASCASGEQPPNVVPSAG